MTIGIPRTLAWFLIMLVVNLTAVDPWVLASEGARLAQADAEAPGTSSEEAGAPDSLVAPQSPAQEAVTAPSKPFDQLILTDGGPKITSDEPPHEGAPVYKRWWFWTVAASAVAAAVVFSVAGAEEPRKDLPDFPNPPER